MGSLRTIIASTLLLASLGTPSLAERDLVLTFAGCTGRMSAEIEHAWLVSDPRADTFQSQRARFVSILDAILPAERAAEALHHRIEAKMAHRAILSDARFGTDPRRVRLAKRRAQTDVQICKTMLLDG